MKVNKNLKMIELLIDYANKNNIILELNEKDCDNGEFPLIVACKRNNIAMVHLIINYAN